MRRTIALAVILMLSVILPASADHGNDAEEAFERLKRMVGTWSYTLHGSPAQRATFRLTAGGKVLLEDMGGMTTAYYMDGDRLVLTHFCNAGNQPRMEMTSAASGRISFEMFDITNLASPGSYRTTHLDVVFVSDDRAQLTYSGSGGGRPRTDVFELTRR